MNDDLISREALRKEVTEKVNFTTVDGHIAYDKMLKLIDNAPTVEPRIEYGTDGQPYKLSMTNGKEYERPKGEWVDREYRRYLPRDAEPDYNNDTYDEKTHSVMSTHIVCSNCGAERRFYHNFCGNCGAEMRKGGTE